MTLRGQVVDSYWVAGRQVPLTVYEDSLLLVTHTRVDDGTASVLMRALIVGALAQRELPGGTWLMRFATSNRAALVAVARQLRADPVVRYAGLAVRTAGAVEPAMVTDEFVVRFLPWVLRSQIDALNAANSVDVVRETGLAPNHYVLSVTRAATQDAIDMAQTYHANALTIYAHPNFVTFEGGASQRRSLPLEDPLIKSQWHLENTAFPGRDIDAKTAWAITPGSSAITVAVIEFNGFQADHKDLVDNLWENPWMTGGGSGTEPFNKSGDLNGWNFTGCPGSGTDVTDPCGTPNLSLPANSPVDHGTQVAGVAAADGDNGAGGSGVCPACSLMLIKVGLPHEDVIRALTFKYAYMMGADVISASWHDQYSTDSVRDMITEAADNGRNLLGSVIVNIPPNYSVNTDFCGPLTNHMMAAHPKVLSVIKTNDQDQRQLGGMGTCLDLMAPGVGILTTDPEGLLGNPGDYFAVDGNSFAAPMVAGVAGLILSWNPALDRSDVYDILTGTAEKVDMGGYSGPDLFSSTHGYGRLDAGKALERVRSISPPPKLPSADRYEVGFKAGLTVFTGGTTDYIVSVPGSGALGDASFYATLFRDLGTSQNTDLMLDAVIGFRKSDGPGNNERSVALSLMPALLYNFAGPGSLYVGPDIGFHAHDASTGSVSQWGFGAGSGYRRTLGSKVAARFEVRYRYWSTSSLGEWGVSLGAGVRLL